MSDAPAQEPTMEEILASIRRIISEDEQPQAEPAAGSPAPAPSATPAPEEPAAVAEPAPADDVLELTDKVEPESEGETDAPAAAFSDSTPSHQTLGDLDVSERTSSAPRADASSAPTGIEGPIMSSSTADNAAAAFGQLAQAVSMPDVGRSLEDVVRELLRPMLKDWLDQYLPKIVERQVQLEVERVSRGRGY